jgi:hypothetical protein
MFANTFSIRRQRGHSYTAKFVEQPGSSDSPITFHRSRGNTKKLCDFFFLMSSKEPQLHYLSLARLQFSKAVKRFVDRQQFGWPFFPIHHVRFERNLAAAAAHPRLSRMIY